MNFEDMPVGCESHYLDSGSFSLMGRAEEYAKRTGRGGWSFYNTRAFQKYMDDYAAFVKTYHAAIDLYSNVDVIGNPDLSWRNQQYLEKRHGLKPVPVVHFKSDLKWVQHYVDRGHELVALGGLVRAAKRGAYFGWLDRVFDWACGTPARTPRVKLHGFGITNYKIMIRYPWWSVDSSAWTKRAAFGIVMIPHKRGGRFTFGENPYQLFFTHDAPAHNKAAGKHFDGTAPAERRVVLEWLDKIGVPLGKTKPDGTVIEYGVTNRHSERKAANIYFFEGLREWLPPYPWPYRRQGTGGFGL